MGRKAAVAVPAVLVVLAFTIGWHGFLFGLTVVAIGIAVMIAGGSARQRWSARVERRDQLECLQSDLAAIDAMPGVTFEHHVAARLRAAGWEVTATPATNDYGVDLVANDGAESWAIQCKRKATPVGVSAVQQVVAGAIHYGCCRKMVVSNQEFTRQAKVLALAHDCDLVGRSFLPGWHPVPAQEKESAPLLVRDDTLARKRQRP